MMSKAKQATIHLRVSTSGHTIENWRHKLEQVAERWVWTVT